MQELKASQTDIKQEVLQIKEDIMEIKDLVTQLAQIFLDAPISPLPASQPVEDSQPEVQACNQINSLTENEMYVMEAWIKIPTYQQFLVDALLDTGSASSYIHKKIVPPECVLPLDKQVKISYANNKGGTLTHYCKIRIALGTFMFTALFFIHEQQNCDLLLGNDIIGHLLPFSIQPDRQITFIHNHQAYVINTKKQFSTLVGTITNAYCMPSLPSTNQERFLVWFNKEKSRFSKNTLFLYLQFLMKIQPRPVMLG